jgi:hypothetical protein
VNLRVSALEARLLVCYKGWAMSDPARINASNGADGNAVARAFAYPFTTSASWRFS